jgi:tetratricopeptide (TPR) repeat protein
MNSPTHLILRATACLSAVFLIPGCSSDARARSALEAYQSAAAANDLVAARKALLQLVQAKDDVAQYWEELGKLQASMGAYSDAYYAFTRAYELDRSNPELLRAITEIALRSGNVALAQSHAKELEVVAPGDPWVKLTNGWAAYSQSHFDEAIATSDSMLATSPFDSAATVLKARSLISLERRDDALDLLVKQVQAQPSDVGSLQVLAKIYEGQGDWPKVVEIRRRLFELTPDDRDNALLLAAAGFRSGNAPVGRQVSFKLLRPNADPLFIASVLDMWANYWPSPQRIDDARGLAASAAGIDQKLVYAAFLSRIGRPTDAIRITSGAAALPVNAKSAEANAVLGDALLRSGNLPGAKSRFDAVLAFDPGNATALRGRSELELRTGNSAAAIIDAQKLITVLPNSSRDRLLLVRSYLAAGNTKWADRTLWAAFQEIPADDKIYAALRATKQGNDEGLRDLQDEFARQVQAKLNRGLL